MPGRTANPGMPSEQARYERAELFALHVVRTRIQCRDRAKPLDVAHEVALDRTAQTLRVALELRAHPLLLPLARVQEHPHGDRERDTERYAHRDPPSAPGLSGLAP